MIDLLKRLYLALKLMVMALYYWLKDKLAGRC